MYSFLALFLGILGGFAFILGFQSPPLFVFAALLGICTWHFYSKSQDQKEDEEYTRTNDLNQRLKNIQNFSTNQKFLSSDADAAIAIDDYSKQFAIVELKSTEDKVYEYRDLLKSEIITDGTSITSTNRGSQLGGAILGGLLAGGIGAVIGGLSGSQKSRDEVFKIELSIIVNDTTNPVYKVIFLDLIDGVSKASEEYKEAYEQAYRCHQLLTVLIKQADDEDKKKEANNKTDKTNIVSNISIADELKKLAELKNEGILTQEEFDSQKKKIIG